MGLEQAKEMKEEWFDSKEWLKWLQYQEANNLEGQTSQFGHSICVLRSVSRAGQNSPRNNRGDLCAGRALESVKHTPAISAQNP